MRSPDGRNQFIFLPDLGAVLPVGEVTSDALKRVAYPRRLLLPPGARREASHVTILNGMGRSLALGTEWNGKLDEKLRVLGEVGGKRRVDMFAKDRRKNDLEVRPSARQVGDRIFFSGSGVETVYVGYGVPWEAFDGTAPNPRGRSLSFAGSEGPQFDRDLDEAERGGVEGRMGFLGAYWFDFNCIVNFLGDALVNDSSRRTVVPMAYLPDGRTISPQVARRYEKLMGVFLDTLPDLGGGWATVHRMTERMVALVMPNGDYDILIRGARDAAPAGWITAAGVVADGGRPVAVLSDYYFQERWEEKDQDAAERAYYTTAKRGDPYPGPGTSAVLDAWWAHQVTPTGATRSEAGVSAAHRQGAAASGFGVRVATGTDLDETLAWLKAEYDAEKEGFWVNGEVIRECAGNGEMTVAFKPETAEVVGFLCGAREGLSRTASILSIRPDLRHRGAGTALMREFLALARKENTIGVVLECMPRTSIPFFEKLGFSYLDPDIYRPNSGAYEQHERFMLLHHQDDARTRAPSDALPTHRVEIRLAMDHPGTRPLAPPFTSGADLYDGYALVLDNYFQACAHREHWIEVRVDGREVIKNKVKYLGSEHGADIAAPFIRIRELYLPEPGENAWRGTY